MYTLTLYISFKLLLLEFNQVLDISGELETDNFKILFDLKQF